MENKKTSELLDFLYTIESKKEPSDEDWDAHTEASAELEKRPPFNSIIGEREEQNEFSLEERVEVLEKDSKLIKRHKHDDKNGDVLVRIWTAWSKWKLVSKSKP